MAFRDTYADLKSWLFASALPLWSTTGVDREHGGFFERIDHEGRPTDDPRRTRLVARQIFAFTAAEEMGWDGPAAELIAHGLEFFHANCVSPEGPVYSEVAPDGAVIRADFDTYDHAFALFALAAAAGAGHDVARSRKAALRLLDAMKEGWGHPEAGFYECQPPAAPLLANPHMHLFEAALEWAGTSPEEKVWQDFADELGELALRRLLDPDTGAIVETYDLDWQPMPDARKGVPVVEPGHQFEWAWLLLRWGKLRGNEAAILAGERLVEIGETHGIAEDGLCHDALNPDFEVIDADHRLWPQTERTKANLILGREDRAGEALEGLSRYFVTPISGLWYETLRADGTPVIEPAKASSLYHVICALREAHRYLNA